LQDFVNSTDKFNSIVVKNLRPVICSYREDDLKNFHASNIPFPADFSQPSLDPCYVMLETTYKGSVEQDVRGVESRPQKSRLIRNTIDKRS
jgi:hypothetical protein